MSSKRSDVLSANLRGAAVLGALLVAIVSITVATSLRIYKQLDSAVAVQRALISAQQHLDSVVQYQTDMQFGLRGYVATGDRAFLEPFTRVSDDFLVDLDAFARETAPLGIGGMDETVKEMRDEHESWIANVERPLMIDRHASDASKFGKLYVDQLHQDTTKAQTLLQVRLDEVQSELKRRIDEALFAGIASVVVFGLVSIAFVTARVQMQVVIDRERAIVETLGRAFLTNIDVVPGARVGTAYLAADRDAAVGGDLYDVRRMDEFRGLVLVADVSGKGIEAAVNTAFVKYSIRALARRTSDPAAVLAEFNRMFVETVVDPALFVVGFLGVLDARAQTLTYASAGHSGAYLRRGESVRQLDVTGPIVGLDATFTYEPRVLSLERGDVLLLATDGLSEARDRAGDLLGDDGAMRLLAEADTRDAQLCADAVVAIVRSRGGGTLRDDLALLVIAIDGVAA